MKAPKGLNQYGEVFEKEYQTIQRVNSVINSPNLSQEQSFTELLDLLSRYESLLRQTAKLLKIGDSTQRRLIKTQEDLQSSNAGLATSYKNLKALSSTGRQITASLDTKEIITSVHEYVKELMDVDILAIGVAEEDISAVKYKFCFKDKEYLNTMIKEKLDTDNLTSLSYSLKDELVIEDIQVGYDQYIPSVHQFWSSKVRSLIYFPLYVEERFIGVLTIQSYNANAYSDNHLSILRTLAAYVAIALDNADAYRLITRKNKQLEDHLEKINVLNEGLETEKAKSDKLLLNILPKKIADRLKMGESVIADLFENSSVLFGDLSGFTVMSSLISSPQKLVMILDDIFSQFDLISSKYSLEKIKTIGDCYMLAGGIPEKSDDHLVRLASASLEMIEEFAKVKEAWSLPVNLRVGIHCGSVVAGVIGKNKFVYDLWGDTVNIASRMESHGTPGRVHCSSQVYENLKDQFLFEERGEIEVKGKGKMHTYFLLKKV